MKVTNTTIAWLIWMCLSSIWIWNGFDNGYFILSMISATSCVIMFIVLLSALFAGDIEFEFILFDSWISYYKEKKNKEKLIGELYQQIHKENSEAKLALLVTKLSILER